MSIFANFKKAISIKPRAASALRPGAVVDRLNRRFRLGLDVFPARKQTVIRQITAASHNNPSFLSRLSQSLEAGTLADVNRVLKLANLEIVRVNENYRIKPLEKRSMLKGAVNWFLDACSQPAPITTIGTSAPVAEKILPRFQKKFFAGGVWKGPLAQINEFLAESIAMMKGEEEFKEAFLIVANPEKKKRGLYLTLKGGERRGVGFSWARGEVRLERKEAGGQRTIKFTDSAGKSREFEWKVDGYEEIGWLGEIAKINNFLSESIAMMRGEEEFRAASITIINPEKKPRVLYLTLKGGERRGVSFSWARGEVRLERKEAGGQRTIKFTDSAGESREFEWKVDGYEEVKAGVVTPRMLEELEATLAQGRYRELLENLPPD
ncbi:MAG: hypothetical protein ABIH69_02655, partial [bacterium]